MARTTDAPASRPRAQPGTRPWLRVAVALLAAALAMVAVVMLDRTRSGLTIRHVTFADSPATTYRNGTLDAAAPLVVVAHGFAGSRRMMSSLSLGLARAGMHVVSFDFAGHGRHPAPMSRDVTRIEGTTAQLVAQTVAVIDAAKARLGHDGPVALLGHSMATDVIIRAAEGRADIAAIVAISMYSDAVTRGSPDRLLVVSGEWETRLRRVALDALHQVDPAAGEGETAAAGAILRRAAVAPHVEHVGVLYSPETLREARDWIAAATRTAAPRAPDPTATAERGQDGEAALPRDATGVSRTLGDYAATGAPVRSTGPWTLALLAAVMMLSWSVIGQIGPPFPPVSALPGQTFALLMLLPVPVAISGAVLVGGEVMGLAEVGRLVAFFGLWGGTQLVILGRLGWRPAPLEPGGFLLLLACALAFALALNRFGAAFLPLGPRFGLMAALLPGTIPFMLADASLGRSRLMWQRWVARGMPVAVLTGAMLAVPDRLGLLFTVLPVLILFYLVYGTMGGWVARRTGPMSAGLALGIVLAWAVAGSMPLFAA